LLCIGCWKFLCPYWLLQVEQHLLDMDLHYFLLWSLQKKNFFFLQMRSWPRGMAQVVHNLPSKLWVQIPVPSKINNNNEEEEISINEFDKTIRIINESKKEQFKQLNEFKEGTNKQVTELKENSK
jgi:hypothetical protein